MQPILGRHTGRQQLEVLGRRALLLLTLLEGASGALADTTNFVGDFREAFWTNDVQAGSVTFSNSDTVLVLSGPNSPAARVSSLDGILYHGELAGGLAVGGTVQFNWSYNAADCLSTSEADFTWSSPGGGSPVLNILAQGGPGVITNGFLITPVLAAGTVFEFSLGTDTLADKLPGTLVITDFIFHSEIPEPSSGVLLGGALIWLGVARRRRSQRPQ
jgi:hypothetical protein